MDTTLAISLLQAPGDPHDLIHKNFFRYRAQIEQDFQRALRALERNHLLVTPSEESDNPEFGSVSQNSPSEPSPITPETTSDTTPPPAYEATIDSSPERTQPPTVFAAADPTELRPPRFS